MCAPAGNARPATAAAEEVPVIVLCVDNAIYRRSFCAECLSYVPEAAVGRFVCSECSMTYYCSAECQSLSVPRHEPVCSVLQYEQAMGGAAAGAARYRELCWLATRLELMLALAGHGLGGRSGSDVARVAGLQELIPRSIRDAEFFLEEVSEPIREMVLRKAEATACMIGKIEPVSAMFGDSTEILALAVCVQLKILMNALEKSLAVGPTKVAMLGFGLYAVFSTMNHSCEANVRAVENFYGKMSHMEMRAIQDIAAGEEISFCYLPSSAVTRAERQTHLRDSYGFECACGRCDKESRQAEVPVWSESAADAPAATWEEHYAMYDARDLSDGLRPIELHLAHSRALFGPHPPSLCSDLALQAIAFVSTAEGAIDAGGSPRKALIAQTVAAIDAFLEVWEVNNGCLGHPRAQFFLDKKQSLGQSVQL